MSKVHHAVIDLTELSPKRNGGSMESNRRRRKRLSMKNDDVERLASADKKSRQDDDVSSSEKTKHNLGNVSNEPKLAGVATTTLSHQQEKSVDTESVHERSSYAISNSSKAKPNKNDNSNFNLENHLNDKCVGVGAATKTESLVSNTESRIDVFEILSSDDEIDERETKGSFDYSVEPSKPLHHKYCTSTAKETRQRRYELVKKSDEKNRASQAVDNNASSASNNNHIVRKEVGTISASPKKQNNTKKHSTSSKNDKANKMSITDYYNKHPTFSIETLMQQAKAVLKERFKHSSLRPLQETAVKRALERTNQIIIMATGGGKSICYQLPALVGFGKRAHDSVTIVVCPLIALMVDQVRNLHKKGILTAACLSSSQTAKEKAEIYSRLRFDGNKMDKSKTKNSTPEPAPVQLLYVTPELIKTEKFRGVLHKLYESKRLFQIAIDEAHCVSTWGHDFRGAYKELSWLRESFPDVPVMACKFTLLLPWLSQT